MTSNISSDLLSTPLRNVISIPEHVSASDFVLQIHEGVVHAEQTLADYVVTTSIAASIDDALSLVKQTLVGGKSKGAFVHGSFGSGKSHFMAVLNLLLTGNSSARALGGLQEVVAKHTDVLDQKFLAINYHLLGKESFEAALFQGYLDAMERLHPDVPAPVLHKSESLLADAKNLRERLGDEMFFSSLGGQASSGWGDRAAAWTATTFDAAASAPVGDPGRQRLTQALVSSYFKGYTVSGEWLEISAGLKAMAEHTKALGYTGMVFFLDELVLWLGQHLSDSHFIQNETSKVAKLVETEMGTLPVPIISFVARQRELKDFLGGGASGAEQVSLGQSFAWWEDRFDKIELQAADLPEIVHRRLLTPVDEAGAQAIAAAVAQVKSRPTDWSYLLTDEASSDAVDFARVYPFSPALVDAMIALSALMQRERTALKLMAELLQKGRADLTVRDMIPVGDLFDVVVLGSSKPLTSEMKQRFAIAEKFYSEKMRPYLLNKHNLTEDGAARSERKHPFRTEDRLAKTLLVAEIAPGAVSLKNLNAAKLAALNFGTVTSFIPGQEANQVLGWVRDWSRNFGEITIGQGNDPIISITLAGVDYDSIITLVQSEDNAHTRRNLIRGLILNELGITTPDGLMADYVHSLVWRGSKREVDVIFGNVRDTASLPDESFRASNDRWKVVIDYPFDDPDRGPQDDVARLDALRRSGYESETVVWLPHFLTTTRMDDVGLLVLLDYVLTGNRFDNYSTHLALTDREPARIALSNRRLTLREQITAALREAYGIQAPNSDNVETLINGSEVFSSLYPTLRITTPSATDLRSGLNDVVAQALGEQYPTHPEFSDAHAEVRRNDLTAALDYVTKAVAGDGRVDGIERSRAKALARISGALGLGETRENVFAISAATFRWWDSFTQWAASPTNADVDVDVQTLRGHLAVHGMGKDLEDLLILTWALLDDREWTRYGTPTSAPTIGNVASALTLRSPHLPSTDNWTLGLRRAEQIFGVSPEHRMTLASVHRVARAVRAAATTRRPEAERLTRELEKHTQLLDLSSTVGRLATARRAEQLVAALSRESDDTTLIDVLASMDLPAEPQAIGRSLTSASTVTLALSGAQWEILTSLDRLPSGQGESVLASLRAALAAEELHVPVAPALAAAGKAALELIVANRPPSPEPPTPPVQPIPLVQPVPGLDHVLDRHDADSRQDLRVPEGHRHNPTPPSPHPVDPADNGPTSEKRRASVETSEGLQDVSRQLSAAYAEAREGHQTLRVTWWVE